VVLSANFNVGYFLVPPLISYSARQREIPLVLSLTSSPILSFVHDTVGVSTTLHLLFAHEAYFPDFNL